MAFRGRLNGPVHAPGRPDRHLVFVLHKGLEVEEGVPGSFPKTTLPRSDE